MTVGACATALHLRVSTVQAEIETLFGKLPEETLFWSFMDLANLSNYRIANGAKRGYVRAETFFTLVRDTISPPGDITLIKELGDGVLLATPNARHLVESALLIDQVAHQIASSAQARETPFTVRIAIGFGPCKRLKRQRRDFVGTPIDQLSRVISIKSEKSRLLIEETAYHKSSDVIADYEAFLRVGDPRMVPTGQSKGMFGPLYYRELVVERAKLISFKEHFAPWRAIGWSSSAVAPETRFRR